MDGYGSGGEYVQRQSSSQDQLTCQIDPLQMIMIDPLRNKNKIPQYHSQLQCLASGRFRAEKVLHARVPTSTNSLVQSQVPTSSTSTLCIYDFESFTPNLRKEKREKKQRNLKKQKETQHETQHETQTLTSLIENKQHIWISITKACDSECVVGLDHIRLHLRFTRLSSSDLDVQSWMQRWRQSMYVCMRTLKLLH